MTTCDGSHAERALIDPDPNNFGRRLGLAWSFGDNTVARGGSGISAW